MACPCGRGYPGRPPDPGTCGAEYSTVFPCPHGWPAQHCVCAHEERGAPLRRVELARLKKIRSSLNRLGRRSARKGQT